MLFCLLLALVSCATAQTNALPDSGYTPNARYRVIIDNDFSGDPDGLFQLAHHLLSPSVEVRGIIGSPLTAEAGFGGGEGSAAKACEKARELMSTMCVGGGIPVVEDGASLIVEEAMRQDSRPLYVVCGAGLGAVAKAWERQPGIASRLTLVWIGGQEYDGLGIVAPGATKTEYNLALDIRAAQTIFNRSDIPLWQVPRNAYRQCVCSMAELACGLRGSGDTGQLLLRSLTNLMEGMKPWTQMGEVYVLGDSPLVLLTALQTGWEADPASSEYVSLKAPLINDDGTYRDNPAGRYIRVYTRIDTRLLFADMMAKLNSLQYQPSNLKQ